MSLKRKLAPVLAAGAIVLAGLFAAPAAHATGNPSALDRGDLSIACKLQYGQSGWTAQLFGNNAYSWKCVSPAYPRSEAGRQRQQLLPALLGCVGDDDQPEQPVLLEVPGLLGATPPAVFVTVGGTPMQ